MRDDQRRNLRLDEGGGLAKQRLPLQPASQAIYGAAFGSVGVAIAWPLVMPSFMVPGLQWLLLVCAMVLLISGTFLRGAYRARPSDVELDGAGLRVVGGPHDARFVAWSSVTATEIAHAPEYGIGLVVTIGKEPLLLATTMDDDEEASFEAVRRTLDVLRMPCGPRGDEAPAPERETRETQVLACAVCGGMATPADRASIECVFCGASVEVPSEVRAKVAAGTRQSRSRRVIERHASRFLRSTLTRARWAMLPTALAVSAWLVAIVLGVSMYLRGASSAWGAFFLDVALGFLVPGVTILTSGVLVDRQAAPILALELGARAPGRAGEPYTCRRCGGPLPVPVAGVIAQCVFCESDNVVGYSLPFGVASREAQQAGLLEETVARIKRARARFQRVGIAIGLVCLLGAALSLAGIRTQVRVEGSARELRRVTWNPFDNAREPFPSKNGATVLYRVEERYHDRPTLVDYVVSSSGGVGGPSNQEKLAHFSLSERALPPNEETCAKRHATTSADGRRVAYVADCDGPARLFVLEVATGTSHALTSGAAAVEHPRWSNDFLYFGAGGSIYRLRAP